MPVQLNVRAPQRSSVDTQRFGKDLGAQLSHQRVNGNATLIALRQYVNSKADGAQIRVVNTTKNQDLAFRVKAFGHNKVYRQQRTAETLKQLLTHAGIKPEVAHQVVNDSLQPDGHYRTATARMIKEILNNSAVAKALLPPPNPRRVVPPLEIKPRQAPPFSPGEVLDSQFNSPYAFTLFERLPQDSRNLFVFEHAEGGRVEFRDLNKCDAKVFVKEQGNVIGEDALYYEFNEQFPQAQKDPGLPRTYLLQEMKNDQAQGPHLLVPRDELTHNPEFFKKTFKVLATVVPAPGENVGLAAAQAPGASVKKSLNQYAVGASTYEVGKHDTTQKLDDFLAAQGLVTGDQLGKGGFGTVKNLSSGKATESPTHAVKYFTAQNSELLKPLDLLATRDTNKISESYAAYLATSRDPQWKQPHVIAPSHYLVGYPSLKKPGTNELQLIAIDQLKRAIRLNALQGQPALKCYGLIMEKGSGQDMFDLIHGLKGTTLTPNQRLLAARSGLQTLRSLNQRGFVHRDIKPENLMFSDNDLSFIDTGMLYKMKKLADNSHSDAVMDPNEADQLVINELTIRPQGTLMYMHKDLTRGTGYIGTQADLHAFGLVILEMEAPRVFSKIYTQQLAPMKEEKRNHQVPFDFTNISQRLDKVIQDAQTKSDMETLTQAQTLQANIANTSHMANLGFQCLEKADTSTPGFSAIRWFDRPFSDGQYEALLCHPALRQIS